MAAQRSDAALRIAAMAGLAAGVGDLLMLGVANGSSMFAGSRYVLLWLGGAIGVASIPAYYLGYASAARLLSPSLACHWLIAVGAALVALFGALTHGLTALDIHVELAAGRGARPPAEAFADPSSPLVICALLAAAGAIVATLGIVTAGMRSDRRDMMLAALLNPTVLTILMSIVATVSDPLRMYLQPSAPNLAHFAFFTLLARAAARGEPVH